MFGRKANSGGIGAVDGGKGRGVPLGGSDVRPPTGYNADNEDEWVEDLREFSDRDFGDEEDGGPDRRRDPLRR
jgi:hypothetical protein